MLKLLLITLFFGQSLANYLGDVSYHAALLIDAEKLCSGALISKNFVVTTAFCIDGAFEAIVTLNLKHFLDLAPNSDDNIYSCTSTEFIIHEDYNSTENSNNVGLVKLKANVPHKFRLLNISTVNFEIGNAFLTGYRQIKSQKLESLKRTLVYTVILKHFIGIVVDDVKNCDSGSPIVYSGELYGIVTHFTDIVGLWIVVKLSEYINWINQTQNAFT